jgi:hypothetical protein
MHSTKCKVSECGGTTFTRLCYTLRIITLELFSDVRLCSLTFGMILTEHKASLQGTKLIFLFSLRINKLFSH